MAAQKGKDLLLKVDSDGAGSFTTVAGLRARTLAFNAASVDITDQESAGRWRELLEGAGIKTARISGSGIFNVQGADCPIAAQLDAYPGLGWHTIAVLENVASAATSTFYGASSPAKKAGAHFRMAA